MIIRGSAAAASAGDLLGGLMGGGAENKRIRIELFASAQNLLNSVTPIGYSGRDDLAVFPAADGGDAGAEDRSRDEGGVLGAGCGGSRASRHEGRR